MKVEVLLRVKNKNLAVSSFSIAVSMALEVL
jgi:hypothetical protein